MEKLVNYKRWIADVSVILHLWASQTGSFGITGC